MLEKLKSAILIPTKKLSKWEVFLLFTLAAAILWCGLLTMKQQELAGHIVRMHVIANSDSAADQALKLMVRDAVLDRASTYLAEASDAQTAEKLLEAHLDELAEVGRRVVRDAGFGYSVAACLETTHFPTKSYDHFSLPAGDYRALRIIIGEGEGQNWWCVVFPTLCVSAASEWETTAVSGGMSEEEVSFLRGDEAEITLRFKCLELLDWIKQRLR